MNKSNMEALKLLLSETRSLFHHMKLLAEDSFQEESLSGGARGILRDLSWLGPQSEENLTKLRPLSRIHIEEMIEPLIHSGYVQRSGNIDDDILPMLELTDKGRRFLQSSNRREMEILSSISKSISTEEMLTALDVIKSVRCAFGADICKRLEETAGEASQATAG